MAPKKIHDAVIRYEHTGPVIWSHEYGKYFIANDIIAVDEATRALKEIADGKTPVHDKYSPSLVEDLIGMGVMGNTRAIYSPYSDRLSAPLEIYFDYTWVCNLANKKCGQDSFCYAKDFLGKQTMEASTVQKVMSALAKWGVMRVHLAGGEPTSLRDGLANYLQAAYDVGQVTSMTTNGTLMNRRMAETILERDIYSVSFSFDGYNEATFSEIRGEGIFNKALKGLKTFRAVRDEFRAVGRGETEICVKPTYTPDTKKEVLEGMVQFTIDVGADVLKLVNPERCLYHDGGYYGKVRDSYYDMGFFIEELKEKYKDQIKITGINNPMMGGYPEVGLPGTKMCIGGQELLTINPDGKLTPCLMHNADLGSIYDFPSLKEVWDKSPKLRAFRESMVEAEKCTSCDIHSSCRSGSTARKIVEIGKFNANKTSGAFANSADPFCPKDYIADHPDKKIRFAQTKSPFKNFKPVIIAHSL